MHVQVCIQLQSKANLAPPDTHLFPFSKYLVDQAISTKKKIVRNVDIYVIDNNYNTRDFLFFRSSFFCFLSEELKKKTSKSTKRL